MRTTIAIVAAALANWLLGAVWFTTFSKQWVAGLHMSAEELSSHMQHPSPMPYIVSLLGSAVFAATLLWIMRRSNSLNASAGITLGLATGIGIAGVCMLDQMMYEIRSASFIAISIGYVVIGAPLMGAIIGAIARSTSAPQTQAARA